MRGYKCVKYVNGLLRANFSSGKTGDIFEIGIPKQKVKVDHGVGFAENGYSFCGKMEDALSWDNYCKSLESRKAGDDIRLFLIDTLGSTVLGSSSHYKSEEIVLIHEITQDEIVQYFTNHPELLTKIAEESWEDFCKDIIKEYKLIIETDEINKTIIKNCKRFGQKNLCKQDSCDYVLSKCEECEGKVWRGDTFYDLTDYYYLHARSKLYNGIPLEKIEEYKKLNGCKIEQENLKLLYAWLQKNK